MNRVLDVAASDRVKIFTPLDSEAFTSKVISVRHHSKSSVLWQNDAFGRRGVRAMARGRTGEIYSWLSHFGRYSITNHNYCSRSE